MRPAVVVSTAVSFCGAAFEAPAAPVASEVEMSVTRSLYKQGFGAHLWEPDQLSRTDCVQFTVWTPAECRLVLRQPSQNRPVAYHRSTGGGVPSLKPGASRLH